MCHWRENQSVLDEKMDGGTISIFFHSTGTAYEKNEKLNVQKYKIFK
jgi:hypothetical protein